MTMPNEKSRASSIDRSRAICGDFRLETGDAAWMLCHDLQAFEGWLFEEWGTVCGECLKQHHNLESAQKVAERKRAARAFIRAKETQ